MLAMIVPMVTCDSFTPRLARYHNAFCMCVDDVVSRPSENDATILFDRTGSWSSGGTKLAVLNGVGKDVTLDTLIRLGQATMVYRPRSLPDRRLLSQVGLDDNDTALHLHTCRCRQPDLTYGGYALAGSASRGWRLWDVLYRACLSP